ncbi:DUF3616 domain-containing protein [Pseudarthrobacter sp. BIM B-2242]|uniref:DUF3616 domain-containing protein n=1 Tax=Pseudarthrobacter sp. BIM B-2242 TaxID=2772401 RepID=UPI00168AF889|nr:DUF3616 domain-containing protein [Pseudarthrobacter sp. BIM B-2242]QOD05014.1 DUF3616 domain-containing protein [Pseudarthrobacter sp. BIM B-2242]
MTGRQRADKPSGSISLVLDQPSTLKPGDDLRDGLSAIVREGDHLWVANDETTSLERLTIDGDHAAGHRSFDLTTFLTLPGEGEIDIEGLDISGDTLWLLGSHSAVRKRVKDKHSPDQARKALATVEVSQRRQVLARLWTGTLADADGSRNGGQQKATVFGTGKGTGGGLLDLLSDDPHLGGFIRSPSIPGKDNGIDCEGLAVAGGRVFIGLRGPVLRGWAVIIELNAGNGPGIAPQPIGPGGRRYRKHFLDLRGLGVRDLCRHHNDLLVLAGPTMELDGRTTLFRWRDALVSDGEAVLPRGELKGELDIPFGHGKDRAEGVTVLEDGRSVLVVYDTPASERKTGDHGVRADVFGLSE